MSSPLRHRLVLFIALAAAASGTLALRAGQDPRAILLREGPVNVYVSGPSWWLANDSMVVTWDTTVGIRVSSVYDRLGGRAGSKPGEAFTIALPDGRVVKSTECRLQGAPAVQDIAPTGSAAGAAGRRVAATFDCAASAIQVAWQAELLPGADAVQQRATITRGGGTVSVADVGYQADPTRTRQPGALVTPKVLAGPYLQNPAQTAMTVMWVTDGPAVGWVEYGSEGKATNRAMPVADGLVDAGGTIHRVTLTGLRADTAYTYRAVTRPVVNFGPYKVEYGDVARSDAYQFRTLTQGPRPFSFLVMNDLHENVDIMRAHLQRAAPQPYELVFFNGDSLSHLENDTQVLERHLAPASDLFGHAVPFFFVRGNHETRGKNARQLKNYLALPDGRYFYSFDHGSVHFVVLDTGEDKEDGHWAYSGLTDFAAYRKVEAAWLANEVKTPAFRNATFRVLVAHMPFYGNERTRVSGEGPTDCREQFGAILNAAGLDLHIAGHTHRTDWVEPATEANRFPISVGGGSQPGTNTLTRVDVTADRLVVTLTTDDGKFVGTHTVAARRRAK